MNTRADRDFEAGERAFEEGDAITACPHEEGTAAYADWCSGWEFAEFLHSTDHEDQRLDDPRHGQADYINQEGS